MIKIVDPMVALMDEAGQKPLVKISGVVDAGGAVGAKFGQQDHWVLSFHFAKWRDKDGKIQNQKLKLRKQVSREDLRLISNQIKAFDVIQVQVRLAETNETGLDSKGLLVEFLGKTTSDAELNNLALELQKPVTFEDEKLGVFTLNPKVGWFETQIKWRSGDICLSVKTNNAAELKQMLSQAHAFCDSQEKWDKEMSDFAAINLVGLKNDTWLNEDEKELSAEEFQSRIKLESICIHPTGDFEFWYNDGDIFGGHAIRVRGNLTAGPTDADMAG